MKQESNNLFYADKNKAFRHIETGEIMGNGICLAETDSIENYEEIDDPNPESTEEVSQSGPNRRKTETLI